MVDLLNVTNAVTNTALSTFSTQDAFEILRPLATFIAGIVIYSIFIFKFYRFAARRNILQLDLAKYNRTKHAGLRKFFGTIYYIIEYLILLPFFTFFWFLVMTLLLAFLAKEQSVEGILLVSVAVIAAIRVTAYYTEDLSKDLAKMLPFALLGVFIVDFNFFSPDKTIDLISGVVDKIDILVFYLIFVILLEFVLRITYLLIQILIVRNEEIVEDDK